MTPTNDAERCKTIKMGDPDLDFVCNHTVARAAACLRACAGMTDPADEIAQLRKDVETLAKLRHCCPQCGHLYHERACGPAHAIVWSEIEQALTRKDRT